MIDVENKLVLFNEFIFYLLFLKLNHDTFRVAFKIYLIPSDVK